MKKAVPILLLALTPIIWFLGKGNALIDDLPLSSVIAYNWYAKHGILSKIDLKITSGGAE